MNDFVPEGSFEPLLLMTHPDAKVAEFAEQVDSLFERDVLESFWSCEPAFRRLLDGNFAGGLFNAELEQLVADAGYIGDWQPNQLMVHRGSGYALALALFEASRRYVHSMPCYAMLAPLGGASLHYERYRLPPEYRNEVFDPALTLQPAGSGVVAPGEVLQLRTHEFAYDFRIEQPLLVAKLTTAPFHTLEWLFSKDTLRAWQANDSELTATQLRVAAYLLGRLADQSSLDPLEQLSTHPHHAVRWAAIQALGRLSRSRALKALERAQNDPHPHIRAAAARTLRQLNRNVQ